MTEEEAVRIGKCRMNAKSCQESGIVNGPYKYEMLKKDGCCTFLSDNSCTIYENRPLVCRFYPFTMFVADGYVFNIDRACKGVGLGEVVHMRLIRKLLQDAKTCMDE